MPAGLRLLFPAVCLLASLLLARPAAAGSDPLDAVLARNPAPAGVVFEIVDRDPGALEHALPWVSQATRRLKERHPQLPMALVTHGQEMFALQASQRDRNPQVHQLVESLGRDQGIPVHVCDTYAGWRGLGAEHFPAFVDVAPSGPAQLRNYELLDYVRVVVPRAATLKSQ